MRSLAPLLRYGLAAMLGLILIVACATPRSEPTALDKEALVAIYNATDGVNWSSNSGWLSDAPIGEWHGVTTDGSGRVTYLHLYNNRLSGRIPPELGNLANLKLLDLRGNELSGEIPPELGNLANLGGLFLYHNNLSGKIPTEVGNLANLRWMSLYGNQLSGEIPSDLSRLTKLRILNLQGNQLSGEIPSELGNLTNLASLNLSGNQLSGEIPSDLGNLANLGVLFLSDNQLSGEIPSDLGNLANLGLLNLNENQLEGCVPGRLQAQLETGHGVRGGLPFCTSWDRVVLVALYNATDGPNWRYNANWLSDKPIGQWSGVTMDGSGRVIRLVLDDNQLNGEIPPELSSLTKLEVLNLHGNQLSGEIPAAFPRLVSLKRLTLGGNELSGCIPEGVRDVPENDLSVIDLPFCGYLDRVVLVALYNATDGPNWQNNANWLSDKPIGQWSGVNTDHSDRVTELHLFDNQLSGDLPPELGNLTNLWMLALFDNRLSGEIPPELGSLANLLLLHLHGNQFSGEIPAELGRLTNLGGLSLHGNQLSGEIPPELGRLTNLGALILYGNQLSGCVPGSLQGQLDKEYSNLGGLPFCGG